ncbi:pyridoxamine 5'-phosphate oxidase family protein [Paenibacillus hexagrammi]|uniref:Pyridoxamine 5'-phosphate oxidase family protein n=1 Tax=Paenibacillus hexagrammi TaxID=2908839 RepID=A0ABY3SS09_9BACL|nr:pyridoxamine 5'-phosphate oxidase family protein [Paenibacillus sp. YPD9-1]UJF35905.1 pyridoxamine 5'-phosphate oxidase family protein [Paenibacillus sp. YPD9-1]
MKESLPFGHLVQSEQELRELLGYPGKLAGNKIIRHLDQHCRDFIAQSPFVVVSTADSDGNCDASPRGDAPGFVSVLDDQHLVIPERPGNRKMDSMLNLLSSPKIGLIFLIPGLGETLRVNGRGFIIRDASILESMSAHGKVPLLGIGVQVEECYIHCAKALLRSKLWDPASWLEKSELPTVSKILADHVKLENEVVTAEDIDRSLEESYTQRLY